MRHEIRFVNISDFPIDNLSAFMVLSAGSYRQLRYEHCVDRLGLIAGNDSDYKSSLTKSGTEQKFNIRFVFSISGNIKDIPDDIQKEYAC